jgi:hypothetical protein
MYNSGITIQFLHYCLVRAATFGHHQVVLTQSVSTLSAISPYIGQCLELGEVVLFTCRLDTANYINLCPSAP